MLKFRFLVLLGTFATGLRRLFALRRRAQGLLPRRGHRLPARHHRGAAGHQLHRNVAAPGRGQRNDPRRTRRSRRDLGGRLRRRDQQGLPVRQAEAKRRARPDLRDHGPACAPRPRRHSRHPHAAAAGAEPRIHRRAHRARQISVHAAIGRHRRALRESAGDGARRWRKLPGLRDVNSDLQITNPQTRVDIDRDKAAAFGITTDQVRTALYNAYRHAADFDHLHRGRRLPGHPGGRPRISRTTPTRSAASASPRPAASSCRSTRSRRCGAPSGRCRSTASRSSRR